ncbi:Putative SOS response-associated peptidase YedK [Paramicrobacterium humi]|uniref:Abasic site processing protein n=2 Tax=Paramicrobacterium humi TaxID=640635 RepID=A0A1H4Q2S6_9MICO|nr:Putative SOS response-associated peptidase YedK [Microbacterium humi]
MDETVNDLITEFVIATGQQPENWSPDWRQGYNIKPTETVATVFESVRDGSPVRRLDGARWSLVPSWAKHPKLKFPTFNARSEDAASKPAFKASVVSKRAIVPANGYYEWKTVGKTKTPFYIHDPERPLDIAALYSWWRASPAEPWLLTVSILTRAAHGALAEIHDRTPVTLPRSMRDMWLDATIAGDQKLVDAAAAASQEVDLELYEVAPLGRDADGPELIDQVERLI